MQKTHSYGPGETLEPDPKANVQHVKNRLRKHRIALGDLPIAAIGRYTVITTYDTNGVQPDPKETDVAATRATPERRGSLFATTYERDPDSRRKSLTPARSSCPTYLRWRTTKHSAGS